MKVFNYLMVLFIIASFQQVLAQPLNDDCAGAQFIELGSECVSLSYSSVDATDEPTTVAPDPSCGFYQESDVWFTFEVPASGNFRIEMSSSSNSSKWALYSGTCGAFTELECASSTDDLESNFSDPALAGQTLYLRSWKFNSTDGIDFDLCIWEIDPPVNDHCSNATNLTVGETCTPEDYSSQFSTDEDLSVAANPTCGFYSGADIWFTFEVPASGNFRIEMSSSGNSSKWALYSGTCGAFTELVCASSTDDLESNFSDPALAGQTLYLRSWKFNSQQGVDFSLCIMETNPPVNNHCANATAIIVGETCTPADYSSQHSTAEDLSVAPDPSCGFYSGADIWFTFEVPASGNFRIELSSPENPQWALYSGTCGTFTELQCATSGDEIDANFSDPALAGQTLYLRSWKFNSQQSVDFSLCIWEIDPPANNHCENAELLTLSDECIFQPFSSIYATASSTSVVGSTSCGFYKGGDVWFAFEAPASGQFSANLNNLSAGNAQLAFYTGTCGDFTEIDCSGASEINFNDPALGGETIYMRAWRLNSSQGNDFEVCIINTTIAPNDNCADTIALDVNNSCQFELFDSFNTTDEPGIAPEPSCGFYQGGDVWFSFVVPATGQLQINQNNISGGNYYFAVYEGTCGSFTEMICSGGDPQILLDEPTLAGETLYLRFYRFNSAFGGEFELCVVAGDCNAEIGGDAFIDECGTCVGGSTGLEACVQDCNGDFGGTAFIDDCNDCVGGNTGETACVQDCNGDFGGTAFIDDCNECVGGNTGETACIQDCNGDFGGTAFIDDCNECVGGNTGESACVQDCNGDFGGSAFIDNCNNCVGGNTGETACAADCNGDFGGTAFIDDCNECVGGNTGETACVQDCNGDFGGTAFIDDCNDCVGGNTGESACVQDCNGDFGGSAFIDNCNNCVGGNTGETACAADCNGDFGGTAFIDDCNECVGGNTGETACVQDCNGDFGGTAFIDDCNECVGGNTGETACVQDCNGDFGGTAFIDDCNECVGGNTGESACVQDCNGDFGGSAFIDNCNECVGGNTGETACVQDCNGDFGGTAFIDDCDDCVGGNTGLEACSGCDVQLFASVTAANPGTPDGTATVVASGGTEPYEYAWNDPLLQTNATATGLFSGSYTVTVTDAADCEAQITVEVPVVSSVPNTQVHATFCNTDGYFLSDFISANGVNGADAYRWEFTDAQNNTLPEYTRTDGNKWLRLEWVTDIETGETYDVRVKAQVGGVWGEYAIVCSIGITPNIPTTQLRPNYTPTNAQGNDYSLCDFAMAYNIANAQNFRWTFDGNANFGDGEDVIYTRGIGNPSVRLNWVNGLIPGNTYNVTIEVQVDGTWSNYGTTLPLTLALTPNNVEIRSQFCGGTYAPNGYILSESVCDADLYQFRFTPTGGGTASYRNSGNYVCFMSGASPTLTPGDYDVQVKVTQNGVPGDWGPACTITISGPQGQGGDETPVLRSIESTSTATLFPNPNSGADVRVNLDGLSEGNHEVMIQIYNIYGKLISTEGFGHEGERLSRLVRFDGEMAMGVYMVQIVVDGETFATERMIVK